MEFMMIRSVKNAATANSGNEIPKPNLGGLNSNSATNHLNHHHNNLLYQQQHANFSGANTSTFGQSLARGVVGPSYNLHSHQQQQLQPQQFHLLAQQRFPQSVALRNNSYENIKYFAPRLQTSGGVNSHHQLQQQQPQQWNVNVTRAFTHPTVIPSSSSNRRQQSLKGTPHPQALKKKSPKILPIVIKSKETLDRISKTNPLQNSVSGLFSSGNSAFNSGIVRSNSAYGGQQLNKARVRESTNKLNLFGEAYSSSHRSKTDGEKMNKVLWENQANYQKSNEATVSSSTSISFHGVGDSYQRKRQFVNHFVSSTSSFPSTSKRPKLAKNNNALHMPNLLRSLARNRKSGNLRQGTSATTTSNTFKLPTRNIATVKPGIPIENVFLRKYDPIRLLRRLRCKSSTKAPTAAIIKSLLPRKKKKVVIVNDFPGNIGDFRVHKGVRGKKKRRKKEKVDNTVGNLFSGTWSSLTGSNQWNTSRKPAKKKQKRAPKYCVRKRRVNVKYQSPVACSYGPLSPTRLRVIAAVHLKRALVRVRHGEKMQKSTIQGRLKRMRARRKKKEQKVGKEYGCQSKSPKFLLYKAKLPRPIPIGKRPLSLQENPLQLHTLQLLRHKRELQDRLETIESDGTVQKVGPLPEKPAGANTKVPFLSSNIPLKKREVKHVISQKLLISFATVGFTHTKLRPLELMADATSNFFTKMAQRLKEVSEIEMHGADHGFPDAMERVLIEQGLGGIRGLEEFYRTKVIDYGHRMEDQCLLLRRQYAYKVRSKVGMMMSNVSTSTNSSQSGTSLPSNPSSVTNINVSSSSTISNTVPPPTVMVVSGGGTSTGGAVASKSTLLAKTSSSSSQPLSPGNSVLAEMLSSSQEDLSARTPQGCPSSPSMMMMMGSSGTMERQLEELMGTTPGFPPNVEIRPNSFPQPHHPIRQPQLNQQQQLQQQQATSMSQQQMPLHQLLASLSQQQSPQSRTQQQTLLPPPSPQQTQKQYAIYGSSPPLTPPTPPLNTPHLNQTTLYQPSSASPLRASSQGQSHLTQLLQRPISSPSMNVSVTPPVTTSHHLILHHHLPQSPRQQAAGQYHHQSLTSPSQIQQQSPSPIKNTASINTNTIAITTTKNSPHLQHHPSQVAAVAVNPVVQTTVHQALRQAGSRQLSGQQSNVGQPSSLTRTPLSAEKTCFLSTGINSMSQARTSSNGAIPSGNLQSGKLITIVRSSGATQQQGVILNSNHHHYADSSPGSGSGIQDNNVISINLGGHSDTEFSGGDVGVLPSPSSSKAKLKEAISQRNLLRLNFEQVPSAGDSTVLLSSSSVGGASAPAANSNSNSVQFIGKVSGSTAGGGQSVSWNTTNNYS